METGFSIKNIAVKIASRCNINCSYCYIYNRGDHSYKDQPKFMSKEVYEELINKVQRYCFEKEITHFRVFLFGGEPLIAGKKYITEFVTAFREALEPDIKLSFAMQTNGTLLDEEWITLLRQLKVGYGISLDGDKEVNDANRVDFNNKGTYDKVLSNVTLLKEHKQPVGFLSFLNINYDPIATYEHFKRIGASTVDFLFPDANFYNLPQDLHHTEDEFDWNNTPYGDWYIKLFDKWFHDPNPKPRVRYLNYLLQIILGNEVGYDLAGTQPTELVMIESNGDIEAVDDLRVCGDGFTRSKMNIKSHTLLEAEDQKLIRLHNSSKQKLARQCIACPAREICGANYLPTRYGKKNGFNNPSVYCPDLLKIITHVRDAVITELKAAGSPLANELEPMSYEEAREMIALNLAEEHEILEYEEELESFR
ncbi:MAG TPA: radical SAM protein [Chitinophaga sp.]|uniref:radical SAM protein n=1 Tax=Chitinophaga sp. TaxID=1869181 RepID=UPI002C90FA6A|nr:radical SAM protein [Chitinophaga sp.]HVI48706.1 radical SAM protein [Chitinophaga sp.]